jgi:hypothetical protein
MRRLVYWQLLVGDVLTSKDGNDFLLVGREGNMYSWLDLHERAFSVDLDPMSNVPREYTVLRAGNVVRKGI